MDVAIESAVKALKQRREDLSRAIESLESLNGAVRATTVSAVSRRRMAAAQKARWAKVKNSSSTAPANTQRKPMSAASKAKLRAAYAKSHPGWKPKK